MDRELRVSKDGTVYAELKFDYHRPGNGKVWITVYRVYDLGDDMKSSYPLFEMEQYFSHPEFRTAEDLKHFDREFLKKQPDTDEIFATEMDFSYPPINYRYLVSQRAPVGIVNIDFDIENNKRDMRFISCRKIKEDFELTSDSFQTNKALIEEFASAYLEAWGLDIVRIN
jgi:hypothetical protein